MCNTWQEHVLTINHAKVKTFSTLLAWFICSATCFLFTHQSSSLKFSCFLFALLLINFTVTVHSLVYMEENLDLRATTWVCTLQPSADVLKVFLALLDFETMEDTAYMLAPSVRFLVQSQILMGLAVGQVLFFLVGQNYFPAAATFSFLLSRVQVTFKQLIMAVIEGISAAIVTRASERIQVIIDEVSYIFSNYLETCDLNLNTYFYF